MSSRITGQQPEFEYAADYVLRSGILPDQELDNYDDLNKNIDYIRSIKPLVAFHDFDGNEQGFRMTHLAMERTSNMMIENALLAVEGNDIRENHNVSSVFFFDVLGAQSPSKRIIKR